MTPLPYSLDDVTSAEAVAVGFRIGGHALRVRYASPALHDVLSPALSHLCAPAVGDGLDLFVGIGTYDLEAFPAHGVRPRLHAVQGSIRRVAYPATGISGLYDADRAIAAWWLPDAARVPVKEQAAPFRTILQWWLSAHGLQIVHAGAVGTDEAAALLVGRGGSGKSVTAVTCAAAGLRFLGDDSVLCGSDPPMAHCLYTRATVREEDRARFPGLPSIVRSRDGRGEKVLLELRGQVAHTLPLKALLVPRVTGGRATRVSRLSAADTLRALAPSTLFNVPGSGESVLERLGALVRQVPGYALDLGVDAREVPDVIRGILAGGNSP
jgi:hypothetical protein